MALDINGGLSALNKIDCLCKRLWFDNRFILQVDGKFCSSSHLPESTYYVEKVLQLTPEHHSVRGTDNPQHSM